MSTGVYILAPNSIQFPPLSVHLIPPLVYKAPIFFPICVLDALFLRFMLVYVRNIEVFFIVFASFIINFIILPSTFIFHGKITIF